MEIALLVILLNGISCDRSSETSTRNAAREESLMQEPAQEGVPGPVHKEEDAISLGREGMTFRRISPRKHGREGPDFFLLETEVTNAMYASFLRPVKGRKGDEAALEEAERQMKATQSSTVDAVSWVTNKSLLWSGSKPPEGKEDFPVALLMVTEAANFCEWLTRTYPDLGTFRFPTVEEWKLAAYGADRKYPWGNEWNPKFVCHAAPTPERVKDRPKGNTPEGIYGMLGNVSEFVIHPAEERNVHFMGVGGRWMGGSFNDDEGFRPRQDYWGYWHNSSSKSEYIGFRVLLDPEDREHKFKHSVPYDLERPQRETEQKR